MDEPSDDDVAEIVRAVEAGTDTVAVAGELLQDPPPPEARSLFAQIVLMSVAQKVKLALRGNQDARNILIRDANKLIRRCVLKNPRLTDGEVAAIAGNKSMDEDLLRMIGDQRDWVQKYEVRKALTVNPKTPTMMAIRFVSTLLERDLRLIARSKNVPDAVAAQARRLLAMREEKR